MKIMGELDTLTKSHSERSAAIIAVWPGITGILSSNTSQEGDLRV